MLFYGVLCLLLAFASAEHCYSDVEVACSTRPTAADSASIPHCNAKYGAFEALQTDLQQYADANIQSSFEFLLMSTHFGNYEAQREGFKELYRKYSDKSWENAINVIKYIAKRGGSMNFNQLPRANKNGKDKPVFELTELNSLAKALDTQKYLADEAIRIHGLAHSHNKHDAAVAHYLEEQFMEQQTECVRNLAGYTTELKNLLVERDPDISIFLFDQYLKKLL